LLGYVGGGAPVSLDPLGLKRVEYQQALDPLWNHANLPERGLKPEDSFVYTAWQIEKTKSPQDFQRLYADILSCLAVVNSTLNGPVPSETIAKPGSAVDRTLCYCMSGILSAGWRHYYQWRRRELFVGRRRSK